MADTAHVPVHTTHTHMTHSTIAMVAVTVTSPAWRRVMHDAAGLLADLTAIVVAAITVWRLVSMYREGRASSVDAEKASSAASKALQVASRSSGRVLAMAALFSAAALALATITGKRADAAPAAATASVAGKRKSTDDAGEDDTDTSDDPCPDGAPPWMQSMWRDKGISELPGKAHNAKIVAYFADAGFPSIKDDETAWCAAAVNAHLERSGVAGSKSLAARSFEKWGVDCAPKLGAIVVMWRGSRTGWQGHVGLYVRETATHVYVLGGNQGDALTVAAFRKTQVLGYRWPRAATESRINRGAAGSAISGAAAETIRQTGPMLDEAAKTPVDGVLGPLQQLGTYWRPAAVFAALLSLALAVYVIYRRTQDMRERGV